MLQPYFSRAFSCTGHAMMLPSTMSAFSSLERIWGFSWNTRMISWYQFDLPLMASVKAARCTGKTLSGTSLLMSSMIWSRCFSGSSFR